MALSKTKINLMNDNLIKSDALIAYYCRKWTRLFEFKTWTWLLRLCTLLSLVPSSPDLNPLDYFVWSYVENITNVTSHNIKASLIAAIRWVFAELPPALVKRECSEFRIRIEAVIEAEGGYIEEIYINIIYILYIIFKKYKSIYTYTYIYIYIYIIYILSDL